MSKMGTRDDEYDYLFKGKRCAVSMGRGRYYVQGPLALRLTLISAVARGKMLLYSRNFMLLRVPAFITTCKWRGVCLWSRGTVCVVLAVKVINVRFDELDSQANRGPPRDGIGRLFGDKAQSAVTSGRNRFWRRFDVCGCVCV